MGELLLVFVVLLLLFGAKNLPGMARTLGKTIEEFRRAARDVTDELMHSDEAPAEDISPEPEALTAHSQPSQEEESDDRDGSAG